MVNKKSEYAKHNSFSAQSDTATTFDTTRQNRTSVNTAVATSARNQHNDIRNSAGHFRGIIYRVEGEVVNSQASESPEWLADYIAGTVNLPQPLMAYKIFITEGPDGAGWPPAQPLPREVSEKYAEDSFAIDMLYTFVAKDHSVPNNLLHGTEVYVDFGCRKNWLDPVLIGPIFDDNNPYAIYEDQMAEMKESYSALEKKVSKLTKPFPKMKPVTNPDGSLYDEPSSE